MDNTEKYFFVAVIIFIILIKMTSKKYENFFRYGSSGGGSSSNRGGLISGATMFNDSYCKSLSKKKCKKSSTCKWNEDDDECY